MSAHTTLDLFPLADRLRRLREHRKDVEATLATAKKDVRIAEDELSAAMALAECSNFTRDGKMFILTETPLWSAVAAQKDALYAALREKGHDYLFSVPDAKLRTFINGEVNSTEDENGETHLPDWLAGMVSRHDKISVRINKAPHKSKK